LDGLPLALELAATRVKLFSPAALLARLQDRLTLLVGGARDLPARQQTLRGAIEWSHDLLDPSQRRLFARLGVFAGSGRLDTAEHVCADTGLGMEVLDGTASLAEQSLLRVIEDAHADARFLMLETIREFAIERLEASAESASMRDRHATAYLALANEMAPRLYTAERRVWLDRYEDDHDNFRAAIAWRMATGDVVALAEQLLGMWRFWQSRGHLAEGRMRADQALAMPGFGGAPLATRIAVLEVAGGLAYWAGDIAAAHQHYFAQVRLARELGEPATLANSLYNAAFAPLPVYDDRAWADSIRDLSEGLVHEAIALWERGGDASGLARGTWMLGELRLFQRRYQEADGYYTQAIERFVGQGDDFGAAWAYFTRGIARAELRPAEALVDLRAGLERFRAAAELPGMAFVALASAAIVNEAGDRVTAQRLLGLGTRFREESGAFLAALTPPGYYLSLDPVPADDALRSVYDEGYALDREAAIDVLWKRLGEPLAPA
jgi:tetratricopeptide (TPR) repeat protein